MANITITANKREITGKSVKQIRRNGKLPAVLYGHEVKSQNLEVSELEFMKVFKQAGESTIVNLSVDGKETPVLIQDVHNHYLNEKPIHIDFFAVNMKEKLKATVPLHFIGESQAVKTMGGILAKNLSEVEVECLPIDLPAFLEIDISALNTFEDNIRVSDIKVSDRVQILAAPEEVVIAVTPPRSEEDLKALNEKPVEVDVTAVEGVVKPEAPAEGDAAAPEEKADKSA